MNQIDNCGQYIISAAQIKEFREPRLMAKFDHQINLPLIFSNNHLAILPISRRDYVISHFKAYELFEAGNTAVIRASLPTHIQSLDSSEVPSETIAINCALASGILADFLNEETLNPTVSGRMGSGRFNFDILYIKETGGIKAMCPICHKPLHIFYGFTKPIIQRNQFLPFSEILKLKKCVFK